MGSCRPWRGSPRARPSPSARWACGPAARVNQFWRSLRYQCRAWPAAGNIALGRMWCGCAHHLQPFEARCGQNNRVVRPSSSFTQTGVGLPRKGSIFKVGPRGLQQHTAAQAGGAHHHPAAARRSSQRGATKGVTGSSRSICRPGRSPQAAPSASLSTSPAMSRARPSSSATSSSFHKQALAPHLGGTCPESGRPWWSCQQFHRCVQASSSACMLCLPQGGFRGWR